jgi:Transglycosylase SLT domain
MFLSRSFVFRLPARTIFLGLVLLLSTEQEARSETVTLPLTIEFPLLRALLISQTFTGPNNEAVVLDESRGCNHVELWDPEVRAEGASLLLGAKIRIRAGFDLFGFCLIPIHWVGYMEVVEQVSLDPKTWDLTLNTIDSRLYNLNRQPTKIVSKLWDLVKDSVQPYLNVITVSLAPPVQQLNEIIPEFIAADMQDRVRGWLNTLRAGTVTVTPEAIRVNILMDVGTLAPSAPEAEQTKLTPEELKPSLQTWEAWDSYLVYQIDTLGGQALTDAERQILLSTLLDARYRLVAELTAETFGRDLVREEFLDAWGRISPILRRHLLEDPHSRAIGYLAYFAASDALAVLDKLGPSLGLEISRDGLLRLARLLSSGKTPPTLAYSFAVDTDLRETLGLGPPLDESGPAFDVEEMETTELQPPPQDTVLEQGSPEPAQEQGSMPGLSFFRWILARSAWAATDTEASRVSELKDWLVPEGDIGPYLERLKQVVQESSSKTLERGDLGPAYHAALRLQALATAWQESCWRQFVRREGRITFLRSYNNTSVGLMQINERVWRQIYRPASLRWNVRYNAEAGCEILRTYMQRYALPRLSPDQPDGPEVLAGAVYAVYNSGPAALGAYLRRVETRSPSPIDRLFAEKYSWARDGRWDKISDGCFPAR